jgi:hypothetical protein
MDFFFFLGLWLLGTQLVVVPFALPVAFGPTSDQLVVLSSLFFVGNVPLLLRDRTDGIKESGLRIILYPTSKRPHTHDHT